MKLIRASSTAALAIGAVLFVGCGHLESITDSEPPEPDRVVNVLWVCDVASRYADFSVARRVEREGCSSADRKYLANSLLEVTIRTSQGGSYIVTLDPYTPPGTTIEVGDPWPQ